MPLGSSAVPPWLNVGPTDYLHAIQAGTQAGLEVSRQRSAIQEAEARRALAQQEAQRQAWEFGERLRQQAQLAEMENERQAQYQSGMLDWRREQMRMDAEKAAMGDQEAQARLDETIRHNRETERLRQEDLSNPKIPTEVNLDPNKYYVTAGGAVVQPRRETGQVTANSALQATLNPMNWAFAQSLYGPDATNLLNIARSGFMPKTPQSGTLLTNAVPNLGTNAPISEVIRYTKDGRKAVFDSATKEFLRYAE